MKSSQIKNSWWERFKEAVGSLPAGPINHTAPGTPIPVGIVRSDGTLFVGTAADLKVTDVESLLQENAKLLAANEDLRSQIAGAKANERKLAWRVEALRKKWPALHKEFFTKKKGM